MAEILVTVKTGSSQEKILERADGTFTIYLRAKPHDGEANTALIKLLARYFNVPKTSIRIVHGNKSRRKVIEF